MDKKLASISVNDASQGIGYPLIKDYIVSDRIEKSRIISLDHPVTVDGVLFILCIRGTCRIKINLREYDVQRGMLLTILPGSICEIIVHCDDILLEYLFFSPDFIYGLNIPGDVNLLEKISLYPVLKLAGEQLEWLLDFHSFMIKQYKRKHYQYKESTAKNLLAAFLTEMCNVYDESEKHEVKTDGRREEIYRQFGKLLLKHIRNERTVGFYADKMCLSPKYLSRLIKEISGKPIMEWMNDLTIVLIKALLKTSTMSVLQISDELNFSSPSFLCCYFKKHTGITPLQYRES